MNNYYTPIPVDESKIEIALINAKRRYDIVQRAAIGESYETIARAYGITRQRVEQVIKNLYMSYDKIKPVQI